MDNPNIAEQINLPTTVVPVEQRGITTMPSAIIMLPQDIALLVSRAVDMANGLVIENNEDYEASTSLLQTFLEVTAEKTGAIDKLLADNIKRWFEGHRAATKQRGDLKAPFLDAREIVEKKRKEYRDKVQAADKEREKQLQIEAKSKQDAAALEQAQHLESQGEHESAAAVVEMAARAPAPVVVAKPTLGKVKGEVIKKEWKARIVNADLLHAPT